MYNILLISKMWVIFTQHYIVGMSEYLCVLNIFYSTNHYDFFLIFQLFFLY